MSILQAVMLGVLCGILYKKLGDRYVAEHLARRERAQTRTESIHSNVKPLIVGREYLVRDMTKDYQTLVYMGKGLDGVYSFVNLGTLVGIGIRPGNGISDRLFQSGDVRWLEKQSEIKCPKVEEGA